MQTLTWLEGVTLGVLAVWNQATYALLESAARPGLGLRDAFTITLTSTAIGNTMPAGAALGVGLQTTMYSSYGFAKADIAISLLTTGVWNSFIKLGMPVIAVGLLAAQRGATGGLFVAAIIGLVVLVAAVVLFAVALRSDRGARAVGHLLGRMVGGVMRRLGRPFDRDMATAVSDFRLRVIELLRRRWLPVTAATVASHVTLFVVLLLCLRHMGISGAEVSWPEALAAFAFVRLLTVIPITPGGVGVVELGLTAALVAAGGDEGQVVASVLIFRALTFVLPIPFGGATYVLWRRHVGASRVAQVAVNDA